MDLPRLVTLQVWGVPRRHIGGALLRMARGPGALSGVPGLQFAKLLGTGSAATFRPRDADLRHWAMLAVWDGHDSADRFELGGFARGWQRISEESLKVTLRPLSSRGRWSGRVPFGEPVPHPHDGPVASLTRARLVVRKAPAFRRAVPPVAADLARAPGLRLALAVGESPVGTPGTFSMWNSTQALTTFAARRAPHQDVVGRTVTEGWYAEELFARFAVLGVSGTYQGRCP